MKRLQLVILVCGWMLASLNGFGADQRKVKIFSDCSVDSPGAHLSVHHKYFINWLTDRELFRVNFDTRVPSPCADEHSKQIYEILVYPNTLSQSCYVNSKAKIAEHSYTISKFESSLGEFILCNDPAVIVNDGSRRNDASAKPSANDLSSKTGTPKVVELDDYCSPTLDVELGADDTMDLKPSGEIIKPDSFTFNVTFLPSPLDSHRACLDKVGGKETETVSIKKNETFTCYPNSDYPDPDGHIYTVTSAELKCKGRGKVFVVGNMAEKAARKK